jgi:hypothetical protein
MQFAFQFWVAIGFHPQPGQQIEVLHSTLKISSAPQKQHSMFIALCCWQLSKRRNAIIFWVVRLGNWRFRRFAVVDLVLDSTYRLGSSGGSLMPRSLGDHNHELVRLIFLSLRYILNFVISLRA